MGSSCPGRLSPQDTLPSPGRIHAGPAAQPARTHGAELPAIPPPPSCNPALSPRFREAEQPQQAGRCLRAPPPRHAGARRGMPGIAPPVSRAAAQGSTGSTRKSRRWPRVRPTVALEQLSRLSVPKKSQRRRVGARASRGESRASAGPDISGPDANPRDARAGPSGGREHSPGGRDPSPSPAHAQQMQGGAKVPASGS